VTTVLAICIGMQRITEDSRAACSLPSHTTTAKHCETLPKSLHSTQYGVLRVAVGPVGRDADALLFQQSAGTTEFQHWLPQILANRQNQAHYSILRKYYVVMAFGRSKPGGKGTKKGEQRSSFEVLKGCS
jgi:hypothetical protein